MSTSTNYPTTRKIATPLSEFSSDAFAAFVASLRVKVQSARGNLINDLKALFNADDENPPCVSSWRDLYRIIASNGASHHTVMEARQLWAQFRSTRPASVSPEAKTRRTLP